MKIDNYFFADSRGVPILNRDEAFTIVGEVSGESFEQEDVIQTSCIEKLEDDITETESDPFFEIYGGYEEEVFKREGIVQTSCVKKLEDNVAETESGSIYELGTMNPDYKEMLDAAEEGKTILFYWDVMYMELRRSLDAVKKYRISGIDQFDNFIAGEVVDQRDNFVIVPIRDENGATKELEIFVVWNCIGLTASHILCCYDNIAGIPSSTFEEAFGSKCRIRFPVSKKK